MKTIFALEDLTLGYERRPAVHHLTGNFLSGTLTAVVGPNGAGKSTLLKILSRTGLLMSKLPQSYHFFDFSDYGRQAARYLVQLLLPTPIGAITLTWMFTFVGGLAV